MLFLTSCRSKYLTYHFSFLLRTYKISYNKVQCYKEQYCIGTWNVRSMNQDKLEVVKQEMARVNIDISGISEIKCMGLDEINSDDLLLWAKLP